MGSEVTRLFNRRLLRFQTPRTSFPAKTISLADGMITSVIMHKSGRQGSAFFRGTGIEISS